MFGVPDMGKVCTEKHMPDFLKNVSPHAQKLHQLMGMA